VEPAGPTTGALDLAGLWRQCLDAVSPHAGSPVARQWLQATEPVGFSNDTLVLATPHSFAREWLDLKLGDDLRSQLSAAAGRTIHVVITVQPGGASLSPADAGLPVDAPVQDSGVAQPHTPTAPATAPDLTQQPSTDGPVASAPDPLARTARPQHEVTEPDHGIPTSAPSPVAPAIDGNGVHERGVLSRPDGPTVWLPETTDADSQLNPKYLFDHFVIGQSNRFAHAAAVAVAEAPAKSYNPLFIYGGSGLGKTHLLHAIGHYVRRLYSRLKVRYVTTEQFTNEFITSIQNKGSATFQRRYREIDVLLVDDIQFLERAERTQEEFFHTFNALHNAEKQIVISSDRAPRSIGQLEDRLRSRFEWGLMVDVQPPELETRIAILRRKAEAERLDLPDEVLELIGERVRSNIRELEGALHRVAAYASLSGSRPDLPMAEAVLKDVLPDDREREITADLIMDVVASFFGLSIEDLCSESRTRQLVNARQVAMYLVRELTDMSFPQIGKEFGGRDHSTVMHAKDKIANLMKEKHAIYEQVQELTARIRTTARGGH
jgi:chromosomal replication initiator protein